MRLLGMYHEAIGQGSKAQEIYLELIQSNPSDSATVKRLVALWRDMGGFLKNSIELLNKYLETNQDDSEAWAELADIYLRN